MTTAITGKTYVNAGVRLPPCHDRGVTSGAGTTDLAALRVPLTGYCYRMLGSSADAEDATQETLLRAYTHLDTFDPTRARLSTWVHAIATNICLDMLRAAQRRMLHWEGPATAFDPDAVLPDQHWISPAPDSHTLGADPADIVTRRDTVRLAFLAALQHLPPTQRGPGPARGARLHRRRDRRHPRHHPRCDQQCPATRPRHPANHSRHSDRA
ncbi:sigma-70 family RNA polymerase sigma factor [Nocardia salmonicida]|uniref:sigma-70 family RNA polymerase sigma factor n=1 Tax=Nocardia salmonicida TaxID=53431 RepID=UPI0037221CEB